MKKKKLLGVFAHPDDESFVVGGTLAKYSRKGWQVDLICATRGEGGRSGDYVGVTGKALGFIRQRELEKAATILGITSITFLDYYDGTLTKQHYGEIEDKLYRAFSEIAPDAIITLNTTGVTNHPDHIRLSYAVTFAFQKYVVEREVLDPQDKNPPKLYYFCIPETVVRYLKKQGNLPQESHGKLLKGVEDKLVTTIIDIRQVQRLKLKAIMAHVSQKETAERRFLTTSPHPLLSQEHFIQRMVGTKEVFLGKYERISDRL